MQLGKLCCLREGNVETFQYFECIESVLGLVTGQVIMMLPVLEQLFVLFFAQAKATSFSLNCLLIRLPANFAGIKTW